MPSFDQRDLRDALGLFATGVTVVTAAGDEGPVGMTVNSFASVSLDPPLVLWSVARESDRAGTFERAGFFAVHVLSAEHRSLAQHFAAFGSEFDGIDIEEGQGGVPLLSTFSARFECRTAARHPGGDHVILVGEVLRIATRPGFPLVFHGGRFGRFSAIRDDGAGG
jgi:flavin reductase (DIM6/NTAB) family NADH-FMN oxidoreductase RutF